MEQMIDLKDLLKHEIMDLYSAEQQIIDALPAMIEKAQNGKLKTALKDHLKVTEEQKKRLEELQRAMGEGDEEGGGENKRPGFFSRLFGGEEKCKGMEGLIREGEKMMGAEMSPEASDAAIIASAQKIEHYEISGYGTARAYARELKLDGVAQKLEQTLNEEYEADDLLTQLAVGKVNIDAEFASGMEGSNRQGRQKGSNGSSNGKSSGKSNGSKSSAKSNSSSSSKSKSNGSAARKSSPAKSASKSASSKSGAKGRSSSAKTSVSNSRSSASKSASKGKGNSKSSGGSKRSPSKASGRGKSSRGR